MKIFSISKNDWAGSGYFLSEAINKHTEHHSRALRKEDSRFEFPYDLTHLTKQRFGLLWRWADVIHVHDAPGINVETLPPKPTVVTYHGTKYRRGYKSFHKRDRRYGWIGTVATPDLTQFGLPLLPDTRPDLREYYDPPSEFTVCHAPSKRDVKGTHRVIEACNRLGVRLNLIEDVPWQECMKRKGRSHLYVDQFELGYGANAIEAWAMGMPVISSGTPTVLQTIGDYFSYFPFERPSPTLEDAIKRIMTEEDWRQDWADTGRWHYLQYHAEAEVADAAVEYYEKAIEEFEPGAQLTRQKHLLSRMKPISLLRYVGRNHGRVRYFPETSGMQYEFSLHDPVHYVFDKDKAWFLNLKDKKDRPLFVEEQR